MKSWILGKFGLVTLLISIFCLYFLAFYFDFKIENIPVFTTIIANDGFDRPIGNATKSILFWNRMFRNPTFYFGKGDFFQDCPVNDCFATTDRSYVDVVDFDAILFHGNELSFGDLPTERKLDQLYVYVNLESPVSRPFIHPFYKDYFNVTMTYRLDSDVPWTYGVVRDNKTGEIVAPFKNTSWRSFESSADIQKTKEEAALLSTIRGKKKPVAWFVSNCPAKSGRMSYVKELSNYIEVDIYGKCGTYSCPETRNCLGEIVEPKYFFYLSLENSLCQDYVTEKLYNPLRYNIVPVVYGGADYSIFAPPHSYINILDFDSPKDLAAYLKRLMKDTREYREYFRWKKYYTVEGGTHRAVCKLCELLHENKTSIYEDLGTWYAEDKCPIHKLLDDQTYATRIALKDRG